MEDIQLALLCCIWTVYRSVLMTQALHTATLVFAVSCLFSQTLFASLERKVAAFSIRLSSSTLREKLCVVVGPM